MPFLCFSKLCLAFPLLAFHSFSNISVVFQPIQALSYPLLWISQASCTFTRGPGVGRGSRIFLFPLGLDAREDREEASCDCP